jgi:putative endonuclease
MSTATAFSLYILRCADGTLYTGIAADVARRIDEHANGTRGAKFLRGKGPLELVFEEPAGNRAVASRLEHRVKRLTRSRKMELIAGEWRLQDLLEDHVLGSGGA